MIGLDTNVLVSGVLGVLADLYALADIAYVGGGFSSGRLHATIEPAAFGVPVIVGPEYDSSPDANAAAIEGSIFNACATRTFSSAVVMLKSQRQASHSAQL